MLKSKAALALGAMIGLLLPQVATAAGPSPGNGVAIHQDVQIAQYDAPGYGGAPPDGYEGPAGGGQPGYSGGPPEGGGERVTYHGFRIDLSNAVNGGGVEAEIAAAEHQVDIVDGVGLSLSNLKLFRSLPIRIANGLTGGHYFGGPTVTIGNLTVGNNKPILLHEFMHVYNAKALSGGFHNTDVHHFYDEARSQGLYDGSSYMMSNAAEFFAVTASCYLYGTVAREPYNREAIQQRQPDYYAYLERLFGPPHGSHVSTDASDVLDHRGPSQKTASMTEWAN